MRFWFDTEFLEDGKTIELISIGVVSEDNREYYAETPLSKELATSTEWLARHVAPFLTGHIHPRRKIANDLLSFMGENPEIWTYFGSYDWVVLAQLYGRMIDLPKSWPMFCRDIMQLADTKNNPRLPPQTGTQHNALADAKWTRDVYYWLVAQEDKWKS